MRGGKPELKVVAGGLIDAPAPPAYMDKTMHADWWTVVSDLAQRKLLTASTVMQVETYINSIWMQRKCQEALADHGLIVMSKDKVPKSNPAGAMFAKAQEQSIRLAVELGLTPSSRSRKGLGGGPEDDGASDMDDLGA